MTYSVVFPILTERLIIRPLVPEDAEALFQVFGDPQVLKHLGAPAAASAKEVRDVWLAPKIDQQRRLGISLWAVVESASGMVIGDCGLQPYRDTDDVELGGRGGREFWRHGYGFEAARACLAVAFDQLGLRQVVAETAPTNIAAQHLLSKLGFSRSGENPEGWPFYCVTP